MRREESPVWGVYDKLRTARLNVKYYSRRLATIEKWNFSFELILLASAPASAIAGLWFWDTPVGTLIWKWFGVVAAIVAVVKPLLVFPKRIKDYESVLSGYRALEYDLMEIKTTIEQKQTYDKTQREELRKAIRREKSLVTKSPETRENASVKRRCETEVLRELPSESFFVPAV